MNIFGFFNRMKPGEHRIRYIVKGDADDFNVTFKCGQCSEVIQKPHIHKGWKHTFVGHEGDYIYIAAQSNKPASEVNVLVYEDGKLKENLSRSGDYPIIQASAAIT
jgi:hypothetical protein